LELISWADLELVFNVCKLCTYPLKNVVFFYKKSIVVFNFLFVSMAPKDKKDPTWLHCQLIDGSMVCNYCQKEVGVGGVFIGSNNI
jgi:hypothetical protein